MGLGPFMAAATNEIRDSRGEMAQETEQGNEERDVKTREEKRDGSRKTSHRTSTAMASSYMHGRLRTPWLRRPSLDKSGPVGFLAWSSVPGQPREKVMQENGDREVRRSEAFDPCATTGRCEGDGPSCDNQESRGGVGIGEGVGPWAHRPRDAGLFPQGPGGRWGFQTTAEEPDGAPGKPSGGPTAVHGERGLSR